MPKKTKPKGPKTIVVRIRMIESDYKVQRTCWTRNNPQAFQTYHAWLSNEMHKIAEECRKAGVKPCE